LWDDAGIEGIFRDLAWMPDGDDGQETAIALFDLESRRVLRLCP
jgi:hypothetical protein